MDVEHDLIRWASTKAFDGLEYRFYANGKQETLVNGPRGGASTMPGWFLSMDFIKGLIPGGALKYDSEG